MRMRNAVIAGALLIEIFIGIKAKPDPAHLWTTDFINFYGAATIVHQGNGATLYTRSTQDKALNIIQQGKGWQYFLHPPFEAYLLSPLACLSLKDAYHVWLLINVGLLAIYPFIISRISLIARKPYLGWLGFAFLPALVAIALGQDSVMLALIITFAYVQVAKKRELLAGFLLAFAAIKFQYLLILAVLIFASRKFRFFSGILIGSAFLIILSISLIGMEGLMRYISFIHDFDVHAGYGTLNPTFMVNWRGFLYGITRIDSRIWYLTGEVLLIIAAVIYLPFIKKTENLELVYTFYVTLALAASPYAHFPDMTILLLPALLALDWAVQQPTKSLREKTLIFSVMLLFLLPLVLLTVAGGYWWKMKIHFIFIAIMFFLISTAWNLASSSSSLATQPGSA